MSVKLTAAEARKLGVDVKASGKVRVRKTAAGPYCTRCVACDVVLHTMASEDRHLADNPTHRRYALVLGYTS